MPTRIMLLVTAILLFVAVWNGDQSDRSRNSWTIAAKAERSPDASDSLAGNGITTPATPVSLPRIVPAVPFRETVPKRAAGAERWSLGEISEFLPDDIAAGEYRIVTADGRVGAVSLTMDDLIYHNILLGVPARTHYVVETETERWHFIRVSAQRVPSGVRVASLENDSCTRL